MADPVQQTTPPTGAMCDAVRGLFLYFSFDARSRMSLGEHLDAGGYPKAGLTPEQLAHAGVFPKAVRAEMVWNMMEAVRGKQS